MKTTMTMFLLLIGAVLAAGVQAGGGSTVNVTALNVVAVPSIDSLSTAAYVVQFEIPEGVRSVRAAWLEMRIDVTSQEVSGFRDPAPLFEVYALNQGPTGEFRPAMFAETRLPMSRPVAVGEDRLVRIDVTEVVQGILANPSSNHGLAVGSLTGDRRGVFAVRTDGFGPGTAARIAIIE